MLTALRRLASTWVAKALFVLLVVSFGIWGIGDTVRNLGRDTALARVNGQPIEMEEAQAALRREMQRLSRTVGSRFENDPRVRRAMAEQAVDGLVLDRVLRDETARLGVAVPDAVVREFVFSLPGFRGPAGGGFSRAAFESFLRENGLTERDFLSLARADIARQQVSTAVRAGAAAPSVLARRLLQWRDQQRAATVVSLPLAAAPEPAAPSEAALRRFHENNPRLFSSPEYRDAAVAVLTAEILGREVEVSDAEIAAAFEQRRGSFETPERRTVEQVLLADEAAARRVFEELSAEPEMPFADVAARAEAAGGQATQLGAVDRAGLPVPELAEAAFSLAPGSVSAPVRSPFGWHVLRVTGVEPGRSRPLEAVRDELRAALAQERAADLAFERANKVEDALAGGATLEEAAKRFGLGFAAIRTDAVGQGSRRRAGGAAGDRGRARAAAARRVRGRARRRAAPEGDGGRLRRRGAAGSGAAGAASLRVGGSGGARGVGGGCAPPGAGGAGGGAARRDARGQEPGGSGAGGGPRLARGGRADAGARARRGGAGAAAPCRPSCWRRCSSSSPARRPWCRRATASRWRSSWK